MLQIQSDIRSIHTKTVNATAIWATAELKYICQIHSHTNPVFSSQILSNVISFLNQNQSAPDLTAFLALIQIDPGSSDSFDRPKI